MMMMMSVDGGMQSPNQKPIVEMEIVMIGIEKTEGLRTSDTGCAARLRSRDSQ
jgi:hypothetical protein